MRRFVKATAATVVALVVGGTALASIPTGQSPLLILLAYVLAGLMFGAVYTAIKDGPQAAAGLLRRHRL